MKSTAIVWRESVYKNDFVCPVCGSKLFDTKTKWLVEENCGFTPLDEDLIFCMKCRRLVGYVKHNVETESDDVMQGKWHGDLF